MREIKFRIWEYNYKTKEWKMNYNPSVLDCECFGEFSIVNLNKALENGGDADYNKNSIYIDPDGKKINKEKTKSIFQQYTGLKDKNGKKIYEGDIIRYESSFNKMITDNISYITEIVEDIYMANEFKNSSEMETIEVIGNIYENPNLLNK